MRHVVLTVHRCIVSRELNNETLLAPTCVISRCPWQLVGGLKFFVDEPVLGSSLKSLFNRCVSIESVDSHCRFLRDLASSELTKSTVYNIYFLRTSHIHIFPEKGVAMSSSDKGCLQMRTRNIKNSLWNWRWATFITRRPGCFYHNLSLLYFCLALWFLSIPPILAPSPLHRRPRPRLVRNGAVTRGVGSRNW